MFGMGTLGVGPDVATQTTVQATKPNVWDQINQAFTKVVVPAANVTTQIIAANKGQQSGTSVPSYTPQPYPTPGAPPPAVAQDNTKKYLMIGGAIVLAGGTLYLVTRKKGKGK